MKIKFSTNPDIPEDGTAIYDVIETMDYLIKKKGITIDELAAQINIPANQLTEELKSTDTLQVSTLKALFELLNIHIMFQRNLLFSLEFEKSSDYFQTCITFLMVDVRDAHLNMKKERGYKVFREILDMGIDNGLVEAITDLKKDKDRIKKINEFQKIYGNMPIPEELMNN